MGLMSGPFPVRRIERVEGIQLKEHVYRALKEAILDLRLSPGRPLPESVLAKELGVSATPLREAFARLAADGLVIVEPDRGATVSTYTTKDVIEIYELRELLECACARHAATCMNSEVIAGLRFIVSEGSDTLGAHEPAQSSRLAALIDDFDEILLRNENNRRFAVILGSLACHLVRLGRLRVDSPVNLERSVAEHQRIYEAILAGDAHQAEEATRDHIRRVLEDHLVDLEQWRKQSPCAEGHLL
jgi:DNA-binding GntR family transcriptional regulator